MMTKRFWKGQRFAFVWICLIYVLAGCGNSASKEESQQNLSNLESVGFSGEYEITGQTDEIEDYAEKSSKLLKEQNESEQLNREQTEVSGKEQEEMIIEMKINGESVVVAWEENESVAALKEILREQPMNIQMSMYGGFEQVGSLGTSLPRDDKQTTTQAGDIVLYSGSQMVVFYGSNSWAYTRLGKITDKSEGEMEELLGGGDVTITLELLS